MTKEDYECIWDQDQIKCHFISVRIQTESSSFIFFNIKLDHPDSHIHTQFLESGKLVVLDLARVSLYGWLMQVHILTSLVIWYRHKGYTTLILSPRFLFFYDIDNHKFDQLYSLPTTKRASITYSVARFDCGDNIHFPGPNFRSDLFMICL